MDGVGVKQDQESAFPELVWEFDQIRAADPRRAVVLESAPSHDKVATAVTTTFATALSGGKVRFGREEEASNHDNLRAVLQFQVGSELFDCFFNARTGYRAQFRRSWKCGLNCNSEIINTLSKHIREIPDDTVVARRLSSAFEDRGATTASVSQLLESLEPRLSKVWFCTLLIQGDGQISQLALGLTGPRLRVERGISWAAPYREDPDAWLDVKGAFLGVTGPYQPKDPIDRAKRLHLTGEA